MGNEVTDRDFGRLEAQVAQLTSDVKTMSKDLSDLKELLLQAKGGWRSLVLAGGMLGVLSAAGGWAVAHLKYTP